MTRGEVLVRPAPGSRFLQFYTQSFNTTKKCIETFIIPNEIGHHPALKITRTVTERVVSKREQILTKFNLTRGNTSFQEEQKNAFLGCKDFNDRNLLRYVH